jgi:prepilin-type N-terminal cleavage/methylation domain-containing protein
MRRVYGNNSTNRGFSLVELLVTLGVLAVLIAISIPVLGAVRSAARSAHCLSNTRQSAYTVAAYQADHRDVFPISADRMNYADAFDYAGVRLPYASQLFLWSHAVRASTGGPKLDETRLCPGGTAYQTYVRSGDAAGNLAGTPDGATVGSDYWLSYALLSDPRRWTSTADPDNTTLLRAVRGTEVRYPASKGVLVEYAAQHTRRDGGFLYGARVRPRSLWASRRPPAPRGTRRSPTGARLGLWRPAT